MPSKKVLHENIARCKFPHRQKVLAQKPFQTQKGLNIVRQFESVCPGVHIYAIIDSREMHIRGVSRVMEPAKRQVLAKVLAVLQPDVFECEIVQSTRSEMGQKILINKSSMVL